MAILDLYQSSHGNTFEVLLRLLEDEVGPRDGPTLGYARKWDGATRAETHVVRCTNSEVGKEEEVTDGISTELEITHGNTMGGGAAERS